MNLGELLKLVPDFEVVYNYGNDVLLRNRRSSLEKARQTTLVSRWLSKGTFLTGILMPKIAFISLYLPSGSKIGVGYQAHAMANVWVGRGWDVTMHSPV